MIIKFVVICVISLIVPAAAYAYVDPGLGGLIFQVGYVMITGFLVAITFWLKPIKKFLKNFKKNKNKN